MARTAEKLPTMEGALRRLAHEILGVAPGDIGVSDDGMTVVCGGQAAEIFSAGDPEPLPEVSMPTHEFITALGELAEAAAEEAE